MATKKKIAIVFAGQGAQKPGMGKDLYDYSEAARAIFDKAGEEIKNDCFFADAERLKQTEVTQPAVYTMDVAAFAALCEEFAKREWETRPGEDAAFTFHPEAFAGFSLGEYAAFAAMKTYLCRPCCEGRSTFSQTCVDGIVQSFEQGLSIVKTRAKLMAEAGKYPDGSPRGAMAAALGEPANVLELVEKIRGDDVLEAVNFNSPTQTVVAGDAVAIERFATVAKEDKSLGLRVLSLPVSGAFHSPIMAKAAEGLEEALKPYKFDEFELIHTATWQTLFLNITGESFLDYQAKTTTISDKVKEIMVRQVQSPVQWRKTVENMAKMGITTTIEVGPGKTLSGLIKKTVPEIETFNVEDVESLKMTVDIIGTQLDDELKKFIKNLEEEWKIRAEAEK